MSRPRHHLPVSERTLREAMAGHPGWMVEECLAWTRRREGLGWAFTSGAVAVRMWLDMTPDQRERYA